MQISREDIQLQPSYAASGEMTAFASRLLHFTGANAGVIEPIRRGHRTGLEIFAMGGSHSRWRHAAPSKTANSNQDFSQEEHHEPG